MQTIDSSSSDAGRLSDIFGLFRPPLYLGFPPHFHGHSLDLMICSQGCNVLSVSASYLILDHFSVAANLQIPSNHSQTIPQTIKYRKLQSINMEAFKADIQNSDLIRYPKTNATELYDSFLHTLINLHAPLVTKKISIKPPNPRMTPAILASKRFRRYFERIWRSNPTALNRSRLTRQRHLCNRQMSKAKSAHHSKIIADHSGDYGSLWKAFNKIWHRCPKIHLPDHSSIATLANTFSSFFTNKISVIRSSFPSDSHPRVLNPPGTRKVLQNLSCVTADELHQRTLQQHWMVYSHVWPLSSHGCRPINWNWTQIKLNSSLLGTKDRRANTSLFPIERLGVKTNSGKSARNLSVIIDKNFTFLSHISVVCNSCFYHMRDPRRIRRHLDLDSAKLLTTALVSSHLDYCNSLLYGIADIDLTRLRRVQNQLACLVTKSPFTRSIPLPRSLHWLPVRYKILFKINLLTYVTLHEKLPVYLHSMLAASIPSRLLRSNNDNSLSVPRVKTNTGARAFHSCAPSLLNNMPLSVRSATSIFTFQKYLKTYLFELAFPP